MNHTDLLRIAQEFEEAAANTQRSGEISQHHRDRPVDIGVEESTWEGTQPKIKFAADAFAEVSLMAQKLSNDLVNKKGSDVFQGFDELNEKMLQMKNHIVGARKALFQVYEDHEYS